MTPGGGVTSRRGGILRRIALYGASRGITEGLLGVRGILLASLLGPAAFGAWSLLRLVQRYAGLPTFGLVRGLELAAVQRPAERPALARSGRGLVIAGYGSVAAGALAASFAVPAPEARLLLRGFAGAIVAEQLWLVGLVMLRAQGALRSYARLEMLYAFAQLVLTAVLAAVWGLTGAVAGLVLAAVLVLAAAPRSLIPLVPSFRFGILRPLLGVGLPLALSATVATALATADRWIVAVAGGTALLGQYSFAASVGGLAATFGWVIRTVVFPDVYRRAGDGGAPAALRLHLVRTVQPFALVYPALFGALSFGIEPVITAVLPQYASAAVPAQIFVLGGVAAGVAGLAAVGAIAGDHQRALPLISAAALLLNVGWSAGALRMGLGLGSVALGALGGQLVYAAGLVYLNARSAGMRRPVRFVAKVLLPIGWCAAALAGAHLLVPGDGPGAMLTRLAVFAAAAGVLASARQRGAGVDQTGGNVGHDAGGAEPPELARDGAVVDGPHVHR